MIVRLRPVPFADRSQRLLRLGGLGLIFLAVGGLALWDPLANPGPRLCLLRNVCGLPCPLCGGTRGVSLCLRGRVAEGVALNPLSLPALLLAALLGVLWTVELVSGRRLDVELAPGLGRRLPLIVLLIILANWTYVLIYRREDPFASTWLGHYWHLLSRGP